MEELIISLISIGIKTLRSLINPYSNSFNTKSVEDNKECNKQVTINIKL